MKKPTWRERYTSDTQHTGHMAPTGGTSNCHTQHTTHTDSTHGTREKYHTQGTHLAHSTHSTHHTHGTKAHTANKGTQPWDTQCTRHTQHKRHTQHIRRPWHARRTQTQHGIKKRHATDGPNGTIQQKTQQPRKERLTSDIRHTGHTWHPQEQNWAERTALQPAHNFEILYPETFSAAQHNGSTQTRRRRMIPFPRRNKADIADTEGRADTAHKAPWQRRHTPHTGVPNWPSTEQSVVGGPSFFYRGERAHKPSHTRQKGNRKRCEPIYATAATRILGSKKAAGCPTHTRKAARVAGKISPNQRHNRANFFATEQKPHTPPPKKPHTWFNPWMINMCRM